MSEFPRQWRIAMEKSLNRVAREIQDEQRAGQRRRFTVRAGTFIDRLVKIRRGEWATRDRLRAIVRIEGPEGYESRKNVLYRHEDGGTVGGTPYVPTREVRPTPASIIARSLYPSSLRLVTRRSADGFLHPTIKPRKDGSQIVVGKRRTWIYIDRFHRPIAVFQRGDGTGGVLNDRGKRRRARNRIRTRNDDRRVLWVFLHRPLRLRPRLRFGSTAERIYHSRLQPIFTEEFEKAMSRARGSAR